MKCLTIGQPYAHLIVAGEKLVENRTWPTHYKGPLLIHAGKSRAWLDPEEPAGRDLVFGAIVGRVELLDCLHLDQLKSHRVATRYPWLVRHEHTHGPWCFVLGDVVRFRQPIPYRGRQGLFDVPDEILPTALELAR